MSKFLGVVGFIFVGIPVIVTFYLGQLILSLGNSLVSLSERIDDAYHAFVHGTR